MKRRQIFYRMGLLLLQLMFIAVLLIFQGLNSFTKIWFVNALYFIVLFDYVFFLCGFFRYYLKKENIQINLWCPVAVAALAGMLILFFLGMEQTIKQYDATVYWMKAINVSDGMYTNMLEEFRKVRQSLSMEYGNLPVILHTFFMHYFGKNNIAFCTYNYLLYGIPAIFLILLYTVRLIGKCGTLLTDQCFSVIAAAGFLCPAILLPVLSGYVDIIGIVWIGILLNLTLEWKCEMLTVKMDLLLAVISVLLLLSRRWYAFYIVGFYLSFGVRVIINTVELKKLCWNKIVCTGINLLLIAGCSCLLIAVCNRDVFGTFFAGNYTEAYTAYRTQTTFEDFKNGFQELGYLFCMIAMVGFWKLSSARERMNVIVQVFVPPFAACILFGRVASMGIHHMYLLIPHLVILEGIGIYEVVNLVRRKKLICIITLIVITMNAIVSFFPILTAIKGNIGSNIRKYPEKMEYEQMIRDAASDLSELKGTVYICGEGEDFSMELFNRCLLPEVESAVPNMFVSSIVDLRDGFPSQAFMADYIVVREPYKTGFSDIQQVTYQISEMLLHSESVSDYYQVYKKYNLGSGGDCFKVYKKIKPLHPDVISEVSHKISEFYDHKSEAELAYQPNWFSALADYAEGTNAIYNFWDQSLSLSGDGSNLDIMFQLDAKFQTMKFSLDGFCGKGTVEIYGDGEQIYEGDLLEAYEYEIDLTGVSTMWLRCADESEDRYYYHIYNQSLDPLT